MGVDLRAGDALTSVPVAEQCALALAFIARTASDAGDAALLAEACGLTPYMGYAIIRGSNPTPIERGAL